MAERLLISTSNRSWFLRGFLGGLLFAAALNATSFFFRSEQGGNLLGYARYRREALGFPVEMWEQGNNYGGYYIDYPALFVNIACGVVIGIFAGLFTLSQRHRLNGLIAQFEQQSEPSPRNFQVSVRGMILLMTLVGIVFGIGTRVRFAHPSVLGSIYLLGPWILIGIAFIPRNIPWQQRAAILVPCLLALMSAAIYVGGALRRSVDFDRVLLGIFICWTPQTVFVAVVVSLCVLYAYRPGVVARGGISD